jgi:predicted DNA-binding ArsR family transcriptional regulator
MADQVLSPLDKEMWLQLAWDWSTLASVRERYGTDQYRAPQLAEPLMLGLH